MELTRQTTVVRSRPSHPMTALTIASSLVLTTLASADALPVRQAEWPSPERAPSAVEASAPPTLTLSTLAVLERPANQAHWPVPAAARPAPTRQAHPSQAILMAFAPHDQIELAGHLVVVRARPSSTAQALTIASTLLQTTLARPFAQHEWPVVRPQARALVAFSDAGLAGPVPKDPFSLTDWPTPPRRAALLVTVGVRPGDEPPPEPAPEPEPEPLRPAAWEAPSRAARRDTSLAPPNLLRTTLAPASTEKPIQQADWPVPPRARKPAQGHVRFYVLDDSTPFRQDAWPNPRLPKRDVDRLTWRAHRDLSHGEPPKPFLQGDWPNPAPWRHPELRGVAQWRALGLADTVDTTPQSLAEWPAPPDRRRATSLLTWAQELVRTTLAPAGVPLLPPDLPNPRHKARAADLRTHLQPRPGYYADIKPLHQDEWPLAVVRPARGAETWTQNLIESTLDIPQVPFHGTDRPNPAPRRYPTLAWACDLQATTLAPPPAPHAQHEWPVVRPVPPAVTLRTWAEVRQTYYADEEPHAQRHWPVPPPQRALRWAGHTAAAYSLTPFGQAVPQARTRATATHAPSTAATATHVARTRVTGTVEG